MQYFEKFRLGAFFCFGSVAFFCSSQALSQDTAVDPKGQNASGLSNGLTFGTNEPEPGDPHQCLSPALGGSSNCMVSVATEEGIASARVTNIQVGSHVPPSISHLPPPNQYGLDFYTRTLPRLSITHGGLVGIGTQNPTHLLDLVHKGDVEIGLMSTDGNRLWTLQSSGASVPDLVGTFQIIDRTAKQARLIIDDKGIVTVNVLQIKGGSDVAEPFAMSSAIPEGSVVSIDASAVGRLKLSSQAYDKRVAGIVSGANGVHPGLTLNQVDAGAGRYVALTGRVYALADTSGGRIEPGDLLTTSRNPGRAMKAADPRRAQGAIIGKAMSSLEEGTGPVLVLVALQ